MDAEQLRQVRDLMREQFQLLIGEEMSEYVRRQLEHVQPFAVIGDHARTGQPRRLWVTPASLPAVAPMPSPDAAGQATEIV